MNTLETLYDSIEEQIAASPHFVGSLSLLNYLFFTIKDSNRKVNYNHKDSNDCLQMHCIMAYQSP